MDIECTVHESGVVQVRVATAKGDSVSYHRHCIYPGQDYSKEEATVQAFCSSAHTPEVIAAYRAMRAANQI